jgi:cobyrinic acid a,c-diamide synthase
VTTRSTADGPDLGIVLAGTSSGVGKTVAALATIAALEDAGREPLPAKAGPDYIDPSHHAVVAERPSRTLDTWMQGTEGVRRNLARGDGDVAVVEGMMGLYDGSVTSTAATAAALGLPVVLVVDASAGMESVGATALGFREYADHLTLPENVRDATEAPRVEVAGIIAQRAHGGRHESGIRESLPDGIRYLGRIPPAEDLEIPDRHLGLRMGDEAPIDGETLSSVAAHLDVEGLLEVARRPIRPDPVGVPGPSGTAAHGGGGNGTNDGATERPTIAVASDSAFRFVYPAVRERLSANATIAPFAPVDGDDLPECDAVYLPGGYPELHADALERSPAMETIAARAAEGVPVLGECGGFMALAESLTTAEGETHEMAGVLPGRVRMCDRYQALDHVELEATQDAPTVRAGERHRGHEFHYSDHALTPEGDSATDVDVDARFAFRVRRGDGIDGDHDGLTEYRTVGTYAHRHAASGAFDRLIAAAKE